MVDDHASRLDTACAGAGVFALLISASLVLPAVGAEGALGPAKGRRAKEFGRTGAHGVSVRLPAYAVGAARVRVAWPRLQRDCTIKRYPRFGIIDSVIDVGDRQTIASGVCCAALVAIKYLSLYRKR